MGDLIGPASLALGLGVGLGWRSRFAAGACVMLVYGLGLSVTSGRPLPRHGLATDDERPAWSRGLSLACPPAVGALADRVGLAGSMWVYAALPAAMLLLVRGVREPSPQPLTTPGSDGRIVP